jgi:tRNA (guanosine-2'-O-)-methyltransferase
LKRAGYRIVATTPHEGDLTPETFDVTRGKFAVFFGTEHAGISDDVIAQADEFLKIPMYGFVESLNVSVCAAIIIQRLGEKLRASSVDWQLSSREQDELLYRWMCDSIKDSTRILERRFGK